MDGDAFQSDCPGCRELAKRFEAAEAKIDAQAKRIDELLKLLEEARRGGKRQAAPFSKGPPKREPKRPGRKPGDNYGEHHRRAIPATIDETLDAPLPERCPSCGGVHLTATSVAEQFQTDVVCTTVNRKFMVHLGVCDGCGERVQGRHELQTSDALGAAKSQLGAKVHALFAWLHQRLGVSYGKIQEFFRNAFALDVGRASACRSMAVTAKQSAAAGEAIRRSIRGSPTIVPDETGWRVDGRSAWMHVFVGQAATWYRVAESRGHETLAELIGFDYDGALIHDGFKAYDVFHRAIHQQCVTHLSRRCKELLQTAVRGAVVFPRQVRALLRAGLDARDDLLAGKHGLEQLRSIGETLTARLRALTLRPKSHRDNERFAKFLRTHVESVFAFLRTPGVEATNCRAEQAIRPAVVNRKVFGGNRKWPGAEQLGVILSVIETLRRHGQDALAWLQAARQSPTPPEMTLGR
jgi:transposase